MQFISFSIYPSQTTTQTYHCLKDIQSKTIPSTVHIFQHSVEISPVFLHSQSKAKFTSGKNGSARCSYKDYLTYIVSMPNENQFQDWNWNRDVYIYISTQCLPLKQHVHIYLLSPLKYKISSYLQNICTQIPLCKLPIRRL